MSSDLAISARGLGKYYKIPTGRVAPDHRDGSRAPPPAPPVAAFGP